MKDLENRIVFVTGGASGIGLGIAEAFLEQSSHVIIADVDEAHLEEARAALEGCQGRVDFVRLDVTSDSGWRTVVEHVWTQYGGIDVLVNNAGVGQGVTPEGSQARGWELSQEARDLVLDVNIAGVMRGVQHVVPRMIERGAGGHVITTASLSGVYAVPGISLYSASKFAVVGYSEALAGELDPYGIGVSILCPGSVKSQLKATAAGRHADVGAIAAYMESLASARAGKMDPLSVGRAVVDATVKDRLYIMTHPAHAAAVRQRHNMIEGSFGAPAEHGYVETAESLERARNVAYRSVGRHDASDPPRGIIVTRVEVDPDHEDEFNQWFDLEHIPERTACPGFLSARRFKSVGEETQYLAVYEVENLDVLRSAEYEAMRPPSDWHKRVSAHVLDSDRAVYEEITRTVSPGDRVLARRR